MPRYRVTTADGATHEINGPEGATRQQVIAAVETLLAEEAIDKAGKDYEAYLKDRTERKPEEEKDTDNIFENIYKGLGAGFVNTLENSALGLAALLDEGAELTARDAIKGVADSIRPELANPEDVSAKLAQGVGSILGFAPALLTGPLAPYTLSLIHI